MNSTQLLSLVYAILFLPALAEAADSVDREAPWSWVEEGEDIGEALKHVDERPGLKKQGFEPSGLAYHPKRKTLFVVSDDGPIAELAADGTVKNYWHSAYNLGSRDRVHGTVLRFRPVADAPRRPGSQHNWGKPSGGLRVTPPLVFTVH